MEIVGPVLVVLGLLILFFAPTCFAVGRKHHQSASIFLVNLFLGWTLLGWVIALVWSFSAIPKETQNERPRTRQDPRISGIDPQRDDRTKVCPDCAETIKADAKVCWYCGYRFGGTA